MIIKYVKHKEIDKRKWDNCILSAHNSLIYVHSFYLDSVTNFTWDALVVGDYEIVMPLTLRKKYGISYLYQPAFLQQAGIFSPYELDEKIMNAFLKEVIKHFKFVEINLNYANPLSSKITIEYTERNNFLLALNNSFEIISEKFNTNFKRNLKRASTQNFIYEKVVAINELVDLYRRFYSTRFKHVKEFDYDALKLNCTLLQATDNLILRKVSFRGEVKAAIILLKASKRLYNIAPSVTNEGKKISANHFLYNKVIEEFSGQDLVLDFEGSDIKGIANFYQSMNPTNEKYMAIKINNLPKLIKFFKK